jgi:hypothetical protein
VKGDTYTLRNLVTNKDGPVHIKRLRPFYYDPEFVDPIAVATMDNGKFEVEKVIRYRGDRNGQRKDLEFLIHWKGYDNPDEYTWEPWSMEWGRNVKMIEFLRANKMAYLIPKNVVVEE